MGSYVQFVPSVVTQASPSFGHARHRALQMYKDWIRAAPHIVELYQLDLTSRLIKQRVRQEFEKTRGVTDLGVINHLLLKGRQEYEETLNLWKQKTHVMRYFDDSEVTVVRSLSSPSSSSSKDFLARFYEGRN